MSIAQDAIKEADAVAASIFSLAKQTVQERREHAAWLYVRATRRAIYARNRIWKRYWSWWANKWKADMEANNAVAELNHCDRVMAAMLGGNGDRRV